MSGFASTKSRFIGMKSGIQDSNLQPHGPKPCTLANCANPRFFKKVPQEGIEPPRLLRAQDFKSCVYTSFTTAAKSWLYYTIKYSMI